MSSPSARKIDSGPSFGMWSVDDVTSVVERERGSSETPNALRSRRKNGAQEMHYEQAKALEA